MAHEHHHEHEHAHHHEHHEHVHIHEELRDGPFAAYTHEEATVGSTELTFVGTLDMWEEKIAACVQALADLVEAQDGIVGHIKAHLSEEKTAMISLTDVETMRILHPEGKTVLLRMAVIVFGVTPRQLLTKMKELFSEIA